MGISPAGLKKVEQVSVEVNLQDNLDQRKNPTPPHSVEVDSRIYMAAERTFLGWIRTGIALMGLGFVVARFGLFFRELSLAGTGSPLPGKGFSLPIGIGLIVFGMLVHIVSVIRHRRYIAALDRDEFRSAFGSTFAISVALTLAVIGLAMTIYLVML